MVANTTSMALFNFLFLVTNITYFAGLTPYCSIYDSPCLSSLVQNYVVSTVSGDKDLCTESLNPMTLPDFEFNEDGFYVKWTDIKIFGLINTFVEKIQFNKQKKQIHFKSRVPFMTISANSTTKGFVLNVPYFEDGSVVHNYYDFQNDVTVNYSIKNDNGNDYIQLNEYNYWFDIGNLKSIRENFDKDFPHEACKAEETMRLKFGRAWQQHGRNLFDKFNDKIIENVNKLLQTYPINNVLSDY